ncbi:MAG: MFS transporter [Promethearchaeia archaeon]
MPDFKKKEFSKSYTFIFCFFYLIQGLYNGLQYIVLPIWLIGIVETVELSAIIGIFAITSMPWSVKFLIGLINDKYGSKKFGRRFPWIFCFGIFAGIAFILTGMGIPLQPKGLVITFTVLGALFWNIGIAVADTALDGLILDVTPKEQLGEVQGYTWALNMFGSGAGGIILGAIFFLIDGVPVLFMLEGILLIISCTLPYYIKESEVQEDIKVWKDLKNILSKKKNWKVFLFTLLDNIPYNILTVAYGLLVLIYMPNSPISAEVTTIQLMGESLELFIFYSILGAINGVGIILGSVIGGKLADKRRKLAVYVGNLIYIPFFLISTLFIGNILLGLMMMIILGAGQGAVKAAYQSVRGDIAKKYPTLKATYYALLISFLNGGAVVGMGITAILLPIFAGLFTEFVFIYFCIMIVMTLFQTSSFLVFNTIKEEEYEFEHYLIQSEL